MIKKAPRDEKGYYDLIFTDKNGREIFMTVGGNGDLFWIPKNHKQNRVFEFDKSDKIAYRVFEQLFQMVEKKDDRYRPVLNGNTITFISEDWHEDEANVLKIVRSNDSFVIEFIENTNREAWSYPHRGCNICFCNSGSRVPTVENLFMTMFTNLAYYSDLIEVEERSL